VFSARKALYEYFTYIRCYLDYLCISGGLYRYVLAYAISTIIYLSNFILSILCVSLFLGDHITHVMHKTIYI
jgi:hypothetical protein